MELEKLREAVVGKNGRNLDDLPHMDGGYNCFRTSTIFLISEFVHTSDLESVNSLILKYSSKSQAYG